MKRTLNRPSRKALVGSAILAPAIAALVSCALSGVLAQPFSGSADYRNREYLYAYEMTHQHGGMKSGQKWHIAGTYRLVSHENRLAIEIARKGKSGRGVSVDDEAHWYFEDNAMFAHISNGCMTLNPKGEPVPGPILPFDLQNTGGMTLDPQSSEVLWTDSFDLRLMNEAEADFEPSESSASIAVYLGKPCRTFGECEMRVRQEIHFLPDRGLIEARRHFYEFRTANGDTVRLPAREVVASEWKGDVPAKLEYRLWNWFDHEAPADLTTTVAVRNLAQHPATYLKTSTTYTLLNANTADPKRFPDPADHVDDVLYFAEGIPVNGVGIPVGHLDGDRWTQDYRYNAVERRWEPVLADDRK